MSRKQKAQAKTRRKIMDAFWNLYKEKGLENITIREVAEAAGYYRSTFYRYFQNLREVLLAIEDELLQEHNVQLMGMVFNMETRDDEEATRYYEDYFRRYGEYFKVLLGPRGDPGFMRRFMEFSMGRQTGDSGFYRYPKAGEPVIAEALRVFIFNGAMAVLGYWVDNQDKMSVSDMRNLLYHCYAHGI